jgi:hypothetical protein
MRRQASCDGAVRERVHRPLAFGAIAEHAIGRSRSSRVSRRMNSAQVGRCVRSTHFKTLGRPIRRARVRSNHVRIRDRR